MDKPLTWGKTYTRKIWGPPIKYTFGKYLGRIQICKQKWGKKQRPVKECEEKNAAQTRGKLDHVGNFEI